MFILHRAIPVTSVMGYARNNKFVFIVQSKLAMKNKRSARMRTHAERYMMPKGIPHVARKTRKRVLTCDEPVKCAIYEQEDLA